MPSTVSLVAARVGVVRRTRVERVAKRRRDESILVSMLGISFCSRTQAFTTLAAAKVRRDGRWWARGPCAEAGETPALLEFEVEVPAGVEGFEFVEGEVGDGAVFGGGEVGAFHDAPPRVV